MRQLTERTAKWITTVRANFEKATGKPVEAWVALARKNGVGDDPKKARAWLKEKHGLTIVQVSYVLSELFANDVDEDALLDAQYAGAKSALRPIYDKLAKTARALGNDVMIAPRKSQVTFARKVTFAIVRAATKDRVDLMLRLAGEKAKGALVANPKATGSDPTHIVALRSAADVNRDVAKWLALAYDKAMR